MVARRNNRPIDRLYVEPERTPEPRPLAILATYACVGIALGGLVGLAYHLHSDFLGPYLRGLIIALEKGI